MTRPDPAEAGPSERVGTCDDSTPPHRQISRIRPWWLQIRRHVSDLDMVRLGVLLEDERLLDGITVDRWPGTFFCPVCQARDHISHEPLVKVDDVALTWRCRGRDCLA